MKGAEMAKKTLYMETTTISVPRTCGEIEEVLAKMGVSQVWKAFDGGKIEAISFSIEVNGQEIYYRLPFRWREIHAMAKEGKTQYRKTADEEQARRVAARIVLRWVQAQMALVEVGMARPEEIFLPYMMIDRETTLAEKMMSGKIPISLPAPRQKL